MTNATTPRDTISGEIRISTKWAAIILTFLTLLFSMGVHSGFMQWQLNANTQELAHRRALIEEIPGIKSRLLIIERFNEKTEVRLDRAKNERYQIRLNGRSNR